MEDAANKKDELKVKHLACLGIRLLSHSHHFQRPFQPGSRQLFSALAELGGSLEEAWTRRRTPRFGERSF